MRQHIFLIILELGVRAEEIPSNVEVGAWAKDVPSKTGPCSISMWCVRRSVLLSCLTGVDHHVDVHPKDPLEEGK